MTIDRLELQAKLQTVAPALADNDLVPALTHFLFTGTRLIAYNDRIALSVPLDSGGFKGTVEGKLLLDYVSIASHAKSVVISADNGKAKLNLGKNSKVHLDTLPVAAFTFAMPTAPKPTEGKLDNAEFFTAIDNCLQSCGGNITFTEQLGITFIPNGSKVRLFATDKATVSFAQLPLPQIGLKDKVVIPAEFCKQMLALKDATNKQLVMRRDHVLFVADDTLLFGRLLTEVRADFNRTLKETLPANFPNGMAKMDDRNKQYDRLRVLFHLAARLHEIKGNTVRTMIKVRGNTVHMAATSPRGHAEDSTKLDFHPDIEVPIDASLVYGGYDRYKRIQITDRCTVLANGPDSLCLVAPPD